MAGLYWSRMHALRETTGLVGGSDAGKKDWWLGIGAFVQIQSGWRSDCATFLRSFLLFFLFVYLRVAFYFCVGANLLPMELACRVAELGLSAVIILRIALF